MQHPSWLTKPPCFDRGLSEEGERVFRLCPRGERIKLCGRAAGWRRELVGLCYHVNPASRGTADLRCPPDSKRSTWPGHGELIRLTALPRERGYITLSSAAAVSQVWLTAGEEGQLKDKYTVRLQVLFVFGNELSVLRYHIQISMFFLYASLWRQWQSGGDDSDGRW